MSTEIMNKYGYQWPEFMNELDIELAMLRGKRWGTEGPLPFYERIEALLWPDDDVHRWSRLALENLAVNTVTVFMGPGDSCKTRSAAKWGLIEYWIDPENTLVVVSSTEGRGLDLRVWGDIKGLFNRAKERWPDLEGHPIDYKNAITTDLLATRNNPKARDIRRGLICVPCSKGSDGSGVARYVGIKQKRLRQISDECFPDGTMVDTPQGPRSIETLAQGDAVLSADGPRLIEAVFSRPTNRLTEVSFIDGRTIFCTWNHNFMTQSGWLRAADLTDKHFVLSPTAAFQVLKTPVVDTFKSGEPFATKPALSALLSSYEHDVPSDPLPVECPWPAGNGSWVRAVRVISQDEFNRFSHGTKECRVHTLRIEGHHSFSVEGLVVKNCQWMGPSFLDSVPNYLGKDYRAAFLGNPLDILDSLGRIAEPVTGWASHPEPTKTVVWDIKLPNSKCVNFVGSDSPNFDYPKDEPPRYPYMVSWLKLDAVKQFWGENSHEYFSQCLGVMRSGLVARRVITPELCRQHGAHDTAVWKHQEITQVYGLDPSYGGEDRCIGGKVDFGESVDGTQIIKVYLPKRYSIIPGQAVKPEDQIAIQLKNDLHALDIPTRNAFYDPYGKGTLGFSFSQIFGADGPIPIDSGAPATERPVRHDLYIFDVKAREKRLKKCSEHYSKFATEAWFSVRYVIECGQMRELPMDVMRDGCLREFGNRGSKIEIEGKEKTRDRMGRSPDLMDWLCWKAGTMVLTRTGEIPIETLRPGDEVMTPFGATRIALVHRSETTDLSKVKFSNGRTLVGRSGHKVFTFGKGWVRLDSLTLADECEPSYALPLWHILNLFFTKAGSTGFKQMVGTIKTATRLRRRDFFTEGYGWTRMGRFLKACAFTTAMETGRTIASKISHWLNSASIAGCICPSVATSSGGLSTKSRPLEGLKPQSGTAQKLATSGIQKTQSGSGRTLENLDLPSALSVVSNSNLPFQREPSTARSNARIRHSRIASSLYPRLVMYVAKSLWRIATGQLKLAPITVERLSPTEPETVYNLTLEEDNVYFANGVLVDNCITVEGCRQRGFKIKNEGILLVENQKEEDDFLERERAYSKFLKNSLLIR